METNSKRRLKKGKVLKRVMMDLPVYMGTASETTVRTQVFILRKVGKNGVKCHIPGVKCHRLSVAHPVILYHPFKPFKTAMETFIEQNLTGTLPTVISNPDYTVTFLTTARESGYKITELEVELRPGGGNDLHTHRNFTETFIPLEGALEVTAGKNKLLLEPGEAFTVPIGMPHNFSNPGRKPVRFRCVIEPGHEGFEYSLRMLYGLANEGKAEMKSWNDLLKASVILTISDMRLCGKQALINPFLPFLYQLARRKRYDLEMVRRYCV